MKRNQDSPSPQFQVSRCHRRKCNQHTKVTRPWVLIAELCYLHVPGPLVLWVQISFKIISYPGRRRMLPKVLHITTTLSNDTGIHYYRSTKGAGWCELIQVGHYHIWILYQQLSFENAPWEHDAKKRAVTNPGSHEGGLPHHLPSRKEHGDWPAPKYGLGKSKDATYWYTVVSKRQGQE